MILQALNEHYLRLLDDKESGVAMPGYSPAKVTHAIILSPEGDFLDVLSVATQQGKRSLPSIMMVPEQQMSRTSGITANILCDNVSYVLGIERDKQGTPQIAAKKYLDFKTKNGDFLRGLKGNASTTVRKFLDKWTPDLTFPVLASFLDSLLDGRNLVFKLDGENGYVHEDAEIMAAWDKSRTGDACETMGQCLILGRELPIARIHPSVKGVYGAQSSGAALVSFNVDSFTSYGKSQSYNAPVSTQAAFAYGTALNYLITSDTNRIRLADTTMVFWADKKGGRQEETVLAWCLDPVDTTEKEDEEKRRIDLSAARQAKTILERAKSGLPSGDGAFDPDTRCYMLGLAPNAARLSVRFWQVSSFGDVLTKIAQHYADMDIAGMERIGGIVSPWRTLKTIAVQEDAKNVPPLLGGQFLKAILSGQMYPQSLYNAALVRSRTGGDHGGVNTVRAAVVKAFLLRKYRLCNQPEKEASVTVSLNESNTNNAYLLGRLFSLMEKVQKDALGGNINATISDRYFGAASATPAAVFPLLLRLSRHHVAKSEYGKRSDRKIQEVMNGLDKFPTHLNLEGQGQFILGYYHQNQANYAKSEIREEKEG